MDDHVTRSFLTPTLIGRELANTRGLVSGRVIDLGWDINTGRARIELSDGSRWYVPADNDGSRGPLTLDEALNGCEEINR